MSNKEIIIVATSILGAIASIIFIYEEFFGKPGANNNSAKNTAAAASTAVKKASAAINNTPSLANPSASGANTFNVASGALPQTDQDAQTVLLDPNATTDQINAAQAIESNMELTGSASSIY